MLSNGFEYIAPTFKSVDVRPIYWAELMFSNSLILVGLFSISILSL